MSKAMNELNEGLRNYGRNAHEMRLHFQGFDKRREEYWHSREHAFSVACALATEALAAERAETRQLIAAAKQSLSAVRGVIRNGYLSHAETAELIDEITPLSDAVKAYEADLQ